MAGEKTLAELEAQIEEMKKEHRDLRVKVVETARQYAVRHNLCDVVDRALEDAGLGPQVESVEIEVVVPAKITVSVDATPMEEMSDDEKKMYVAQHLKLNMQVNPQNTLLVRPVGVGARSIVRHPAVELGEIEVKGLGTIPPPPPDPLGAPNGYVARYTSDDGRVLHFFPEEQRRQYGNYASAMCGDVRYTYWTSLTETSRRGESRVCAKCSTRAAALSS